MPRLIVFVLLLALTACATPTQPTAAPAPAPAQAAQAPATPRPEPPAAPQPTDVPTPTPAPTTTPTPAPTPTPTQLPTTEPALLVAFIGDQGSGPGRAAVLELIKAEGADLVLHQGDLDYKNDPRDWDGAVTEVLGATFPYFVSIGNHDTAAWAGPHGYQAKLQARLERVPGVSCTGATWGSSRSAAIAACRLCWSHRG